MTLALILAVVPLLLAAQEHPSAELAEDARREQLMRLALNPDAAACRQIESALTDSSSDIRRRAANALYWKCDRAQTARSAARSLWQSVSMGNAHAGAILLLGYATPEEAVPWLKKAFARGYMVKLATSSKPVPAEFAARVALARLRDGAALAELRSAFTKPTVPEALFLLAALRDIDDPESLKAAAALLGDARECPGADSDLTRRVRDVAVEALADRFALKLSFAVGSGRMYSDEETREVRNRIASR